jgi:hypothetical protein
MTDSECRRTQTDLPQNGSVSGWTLLIPKAASEHDAEPQPFVSQPHNMLLKMLPLIQAAAWEGGGGVPEIWKQQLPKR